MMLYNDLYKYMVTQEGIEYAIGFVIGTYIQDKRDGHDVPENIWDFVESTFSDNFSSAFYTGLATGGDK